MGMSDNEERQRILAEQYSHLYKMYAIKSMKDYEGSIIKFECVIDNERGVFKERRSLQSKDHILEQVVYELATTLGLRCCKASCRKIKQDNEFVFGSFSRFEVVDMNNVMTMYKFIFGEDAPKGMSEFDRTPEVSAMDIFNIINGAKASKIRYKQQFLQSMYRYIIFDYIMGQQDRHMENLSVYMSAKNGAMLYPIYDNGICCHSTLGNDAAIVHLKHLYFSSRMGISSDIYEALWRYRALVCPGDLRNIVNYNKLTKENILRAIKVSNKYNQLTQERINHTVQFILGHVREIDNLNRGIVT